MVVFAFSCKNDKSKEKNLDLLQYGFPISINAPENAEVKTSDFGIMQDLTVKGDDNYSIQILKGEATTNDVAKSKAEQLSLVKSGMYFSKVIEEYEDGFIFEKDIDGKLNYDFRYIKIMGDQEYIFQTGLIGTFTESEVKDLYASVK